jgi:hypothetical protein
VHPDRRDSIKVETPAPAPVPKGRERGRERRLFGSVLGALSQNSASAAQRRRSEIEKRQQAQRKQEDDESELRKQERLARRKAQRWREQVQFEQAQIRVRHDNLLAQAHFLRTTTEPRLYYKPWETTQDEENRIQSQIAEARELIRQELGEPSLGTGHVEREPDEGLAESNADATLSGKAHEAMTSAAPVKADGGPTDASEPFTKTSGRDDDHAERSVKASVNEERAAEDAPQIDATMHEATADEGAKEVMDEHGEEVVEAAEDTVIY